MNFSSTDLNYCGFPPVPRASICCSSRFSSRSSCSFTSCTYFNWLAEATAGGEFTNPTVSAAGGTRYRSNNDEFGRERREARYYGSMGEDARLPGSQIGTFRLPLAAEKPLLAPESLPETSKSFFMHSNISRSERGSGYASGSTGSETTVAGYGSRTGSPRDQFGASQLSSCAKYKSESALSVVPMPVLRAERDVDSSYKVCAAFLKKESPRSGERRPALRHRLTMNLTPEPSRYLREVEEGKWNLQPNSEGMNPLSPSKGRTPRLLLVLEESFFGNRVLRNLDIDGALAAWESLVESTCTPREMSERGKSTREYDDQLEIEIRDLSSHFHFLHRWSDQSSEGLLQALEPSYGAYHSSSTSGSPLSDHEVNKSLRCEGRVEKAIYISLAFGKRAVADVRSEETRLTRVNNLSSDVLFGWSLGTALSRGVSIIDFSTAGVRITLIDTDEIAYSDDDDAIGDSPSFINRRNLMALWSRVDTELALQNGLFQRHLSVSVDIPSSTRRRKEQQNDLSTVFPLVALKKDELFPLTTVVQKMPHLPQDPQLIQQPTPRDLLLPRFSIGLISTPVSSHRLSRWPKISQLTRSD
ncbi:hypothetical protein Dimus_035995 [Dionaea muscipula]